MKRFKFIITLTMGCSLLHFASCKKENTNPPVNNNPNDTLPVNVLNTSSGFAQFYDDVLSLSEVAGSFNSPGVGVCDFTIDADDNFNLVYYGEQPTQQDAFRSYYRISKNIQNNTVVSLPSGADNLNTSTQIAGNKAYALTQYRPYTNYFTYQLTMAESSWPYSKTVQYDGDIYCTIGPTANPVGVPDMGYTYPCLNPVASANDNAFGYFTSGVPNPNYLLRSVTGNGFSFLNKSPNSLKVSFLESKLAGTNSCIAIIVRPDSVIAYSVDNAYLRSGILSVVQPTGMVGASNFKSIRHYSADGSLMGMLVFDEVSGQVWTYSFNFNTQQLTKYLDGVLLDYSGAGTDMDLDEYGNVYYTGYAGNGTNTTGVSIYKKDAGGAVSLVGQDNLLKYGTVIKLKILKGKVYFAVSGKKTGSNGMYQVSILKQD